MTLHMMYSGYKLHEQGDNIVLTYYFLNFEPVQFSIFSSNYCLLTWMQFSQETVKVVWYYNLFKTFPVCDPELKALV